MGSSVEQREADGDRSAGDHRGTRAEKRWQLKRCGCAAGSMLQRTILRQKVTTRTGLRARSEFSPLSMDRTLCLPLERANEPRAARRLKNIGN